MGLETLLGAGLRLYHNGDVTLHRLLSALSARPAELLGLSGGRLVKGAPADLVLIDLEMPWTVAREDLRSKSTNTPFDEARFEGRALVTFVAGRPVYHYG
ncbi:MAG: hypothetical protein A49_00630 [Methyloceanibacter sp.]|nr:MAG: hypothetical protein A49_00630 [Methyloceanibacter sp.]